MIWPRNVWKISIANIQMFVYLCCSFSRETDAYYLYAQFYVDLLLCYVYKMKQNSGELALFML
jgi:hypothetical protein